MQAFSHEASPAAHASTHWMPALHVESAWHAESCDAQFCWMHCIGSVAAAIASVAARVV